jgi:uncharacterized protein (TIRG00374 family)
MHVATKKKLAVVFVGFCILGFVVYRSGGLIHLPNFSGAKLLQAVRNANPYYLILSLVAIYGCYALRALRWKVFQQNLGPSNFWSIYKLTLAGFAAVFLLGRAGEPVRPLLLARKEKLPLADMFGIYVLERIFDTASTASIAGIGLLLFRSHTLHSETASTLVTAARTTGTLLFAGVFAAVALLVYFRLHGTALLERRLQGSLGAHGWRARLARIVLGFARGVQTIRTWRDLALALFYSTAHWLLVLLTYFWISHSFNGTLATISLSGSMLVLAFTLVGSAVQLPVAGGGSQVASFLAYTTIFGVENEAATVAAVVIWLITFAGCSLAGVPLLIHEGWSLGELRRMAEHEDELIEQAVAGNKVHEPRRGEPAE